MFFPTRETIQNWINEYNNTSLPFTTVPIIDPDALKNKNVPLKKMKTIINRCYDKFMSTKDIIDDFGVISFTREFKYL